MSTKRGRKKVQPKPAQPQLDSSDGPDPPSVFPKPPAPTPASPLVALAKQAISPVIAAAKVVTAAAAAALPAIPEASAVDVNSLDVDQQLLAEPSSPKAAANHHTYLPADAEQHQERDQQHTAEFNTHNQQQGTPCMEEMEEHHSFGHTPPAGSFKHAVCRAASFLKSRSSSSSMLCCLVLLLLVLAASHGSTLKAQQVIIATQQQQAAAQAAALQQLHQQLEQAKLQLQELPDMKQLQDTASSCRLDLQQLASSHAMLHSSVESLAAAGQQLAANMSSMGQSSKLGEKAWQLLSAVAADAGSAAAQETAGSDAAGAAGAADGVTTGAMTPSLILLRRSMEHHSLKQQLEEGKQMISNLPSQVQQEVQQQLSAALPPVDLALADCGARVVFHTPFSSSALPAPQSPTTQFAWIQQLVAKSLPLSTKPAGSAAAATGASLRPKHALLSAAEVNSIVLRPAGQYGCSERCLPLVVGRRAPAVLEIALPQLMDVQSITLHYPPGSCKTQPAAATTAADADRAGPASSNSRLADMPGKFHVALANSSSCSRSGLCSWAGSSAVLNATGEPGGVNASGQAHDKPVLDVGVSGVQQAVQVNATSYSSGRVVVKFRGAEPTAQAKISGGEGAASSGGVVADRVIVHVGSSVTGGDQVCMHRVSVQGRPLNPAAFC